MDNSNHKNNFALAFSAFFLLCAVLTLNTSCACNRVDCIDPDSGLVELDFTANDRDAVFGESPIVDFAEISLTSTGGRDISLREFNGQISARLEGDTLYTLIVGSVDTLLLQGTRSFVAKGECCDAFEFSRFTADGSEICGSGCESLEIILD